MSNFVKQLPPYLGKVASQHSEQRRALARRRERLLELLRETG